MTDRINLDLFMIRIGKVIREIEMERLNKQNEQ